MGHAQANVPFAQQSGYSGQVIGQFPYVTAIPETGINGSTLPNGETLRLGKVPDPVNSSKKALAFQLAPTDPMTSSSRRSEISFPPKIELDKTYWVAFSAYVYNWGTLSGGDQSLFGTQVHSGDSSRGLSPSFTLVTYCCKNTFQVAAMHSTNSSPTPSNTVTTKSAEVPIPFGRWADFVFKFRESQSSSGFVQAWMDGNQIMNYQGPLGFRTPGYLDYVKFGYYNWSSFSSSRKVLLRSPVVVLDPTGSKYQASDLRSFVQAN